jgi:hypothetical protein
MRKSKPCIILLSFLLGLSACSNKSQNNNTSIAATINADSISTNEVAIEQTLLNPKFDENKIHGIGVFKIGTTVENSIGELLKKRTYTFDSIWNDDQMLEIVTHKPNPLQWIFKFNHAPTTATKFTTIST